MKERPVYPYCYPGTTVLMNIPGYRDQTHLSAFEAEKVALNIGGLKENPIATTSALQRLQETHRRIFEGVYEWAGQFRVNTGRMSKARNGDTVTYADSSYIQPLLEKVFSSLATEKHLRELSPQKFAERCAHYYGEIDAIHPFREGNSRTLRQFTSDLALQAGHKLDWAALTRDAKMRGELYGARDLAVATGDSTKLAGIIVEVLTSPAAERKNISEDKRIEVEHELDR